MKSTPEYNEDFIKGHIIHLFKAGWRGRYKEETHQERVIGATMAKSMQLLANNMELDINFDRIELDIELENIEKGM